MQGCDLVCLSHNAAFKPQFKFTGKKKSGF